MSEELKLPSELPEGFTYTDLTGLSEEQAEEARRKADGDGEDERPARGRERGLYGGKGRIVHVQEQFDRCLEPFGKISHGHAPPCAGAQ